MTGLPLNPSGRHSGCRLGLDPTGALMISTGDTVDPAAPQTVTNLGGKTLRADLHTGAPLPGAPFPQSPYVYSFGHRNLQGIVTRPGTNQAFTAEHGPDIVGEVKPRPSRRKLRLEPLAGRHRHQLQRERPDDRHHPLPRRNTGSVELR
jgi:glucose/arabinose dehydrogenase